jgi:hypothetical protein
MYVFIKDNIVVGLSQDPNGIPEYETMCGVEEFQSVSIGDSVIDGIYVNKNGIPSHCVTKLAFMNKFTLQELGAIESSLDPIVKVLQRQQAIAEFIDLSDPKTAEGIGYLVMIGILTSTRMNEILTVI